MTSITVSSCRSWRQSPSSDLTGPSSFGSSWACAGLGSIGASCSTKELCCRTCATSSRISCRCRPQQIDEEDEGVELAVVDFVDAYQTIRVHPDEQRHQVIAGFDGSYYVMRSVAFGGAGSPLIWDRASAFLGRSGQALYSASEARPEIYVDAPLIASRGSPAQRKRNLPFLLLWWLALGPDLSWSKFQMGGRVFLDRCRDCSRLADASVRHLACRFREETAGQHRHHHGNKRLVRRHIGRVRNDGGGSAP